MSEESEAAGEFDGSGLLEERPAGARPDKHTFPIVGSIELGFNR